MIHMIPNLHFKGNCRQAIELYQRAFGAEVKALLRYADANPQDFIMNDKSHGDMIYHAEIVIGSDRLMLNDMTKDDYRKGNSLSLLVHFDSKAELKAAYDVLVNNATIISPMESTTYCACFASLVDEYGMQWELMAG